MLPETLHINQISRFHKVMKDLTTSIENETDEKKKGELSFKYFQLTELWRQLDEFIEFRLKHELDCMQL